MANVVARRHKMMKLRPEAEAKFIPNGIPNPKTLFALEEAGAAAYFRTAYKMRIVA